MVSATISSALPPPASLEKKQITRTRVSYSCQTCRRRKVKCDKQHPICSGCQKADETCIYSDEKPAGGTGTGAKDVVLEDSRKRRAPDAEATLDQSHLSTINAIEGKLNELTSLLQDVGLARVGPSGQSLQASKQKTHGMAGPYAISGSGIKRWPVPNGTDTTDHLDTGFRDIMTRMDELSGSLRTTFDNGPSFSSPDPMRKEGQPSIFHPKQTMQRIVDVTSKESSPDVLAPTGDESNALFRSWLFSVYPVLPIFPPKIVLRKYRAFEEWYCKGMDKGEPNPDVSFMPYLNTIWHGGMRNLSEEAMKKWFPWIKWDSTWMMKLEDRLLRYLDDQSLSAASPWALAASIYVQHVASRGQNNLAASLRNSMNVRSLYVQNLHHEKFMTALSKHEQETRRRIYWEIHGADVDLAAVSGTPYVLQQQFTNMEPISELKDSILATQDAADYLQHLKEPGSQSDKADDPYNCQTTSLVSVFYQFAKARQILNTAVKKVLRINMSAEPAGAPGLTEVRKALVSARNVVSSMILQIPSRGVPELDFTPAFMSSGDSSHLEAMAAPLTEDDIDHFLRDGQNLSSPTARSHRTVVIAFHKWARIVLSMLADRAECISYAPFLRNSKSRLWAVGRHCALKACHGYMRKFISLGMDPDLQHFKWTWASMFQPMHATIILLVDLHDRPHSEEAPRSRAMIDQVFSLAAALPNAGHCDMPLPLREGGEEAWLMLRKLRYKAWQKAGLDPDVLWSEEDQMAVGVGKPLNENDLFIRSLREDIILSHKRLHDKKAIQMPAQMVRGGTNKVILHPYDAGSLEGMGELLTRNVELETTFEKPHLRLRARSDQEPMPFPLQARPVINGNAYLNDHEWDPAAINIGELIRKIRESQQSTGVAPSRAAVPSDHLPPTEGRTCDFRTQRSVENAALQDLLEQNGPSMSTVQPQSQPAFDAAGINQHIRNRAANVRENGPLPFHTSAPKASYGNLASHTAAWPDLSNIYADQAPYTEVTSDPTTSSALPVSNQMSMDIDFDWDKWDELFGQAMEYEDVFMDNVASFEQDEVVA